MVSYAKNYLAVHFKLDYVNVDGDISNYYPDFLVKLTDGRIVVVETKGQEDLDVPLKVQRIRQWCEDINGMQSDVTYTSLLLLDALVGASVDTDRASQRLYLTS